jgi:hypothetical protein
MIATNSVVSVAHIPLSVSQKLKEEFSLYAFTTPSVSTVTAAAIDKLDQHDLVMNEFQERAKVIEADVLLSTTGKQKQMEALAKEFFAKLRFIAEAVENRRQAAAELRKDLEKLPSPGGDKVIEFLAGQEIRTELRKLDETGRMKRLSNSMMRKDLAILKAIEHGPFGPNEFVPDEYRERLREQLLEKNQAAELTRWKALVFVGDKLQLLANVLDTTLGKYRIETPTFPAKTETRTVDLKSVNQQASPDKSKVADCPPDKQPAFV